MSLKDLIPFWVSSWTVKTVIAAYKLEENLRGIDKTNGKEHCFNRIFIFLIWLPGHFKKYDTFEDYHFQFVEDWVMKSVSLAIF